MMTSVRGAALGAASLVLVALGGGEAAAALMPGEYACVGSGGTILIGLGFRVLTNGTYTDLDNTTSGRLAYGADGSTVTFVGGHLDGQVGRDLRGSNFRINAISCSHM
jgi:hypothetical protein